MKRIKRKERAPEVSVRLRRKRENAEEGVEAEEKRKGRKNVEIRNTGKRFQRKAARMENGGDGTFNGVEWLLRSL
jgi:hypothetical protein